MAEHSYEEITPYPIKRARNEDTVERAVRSLLYYQEKSLVQVVLNRMEQENDAIEKFKNKIYLNIIRAGAEQSINLKEKYEAIKKNIEQGYSHEKTHKLWQKLDETITVASEASKAARGYIISLLNEDDPKLTLYQNVFHQHENEVSMLTDVIHSKNAVEEYSREDIAEIRSQIHNSAQQYRESLEQPYKDLETAFISLSMEDQDVFEKLQIPPETLYGVRPSEAFDMSPVEARANAEMVTARRELLQPVLDYKTEIVFGKQGGNIEPSSGLSI